VVAVLVRREDGRDPVDAARIDERAGQPPRSGRQERIDQDEVVAAPEGEACLTERDDPDRAGGRPPGGQARRDVGRRRRRHRTPRRAAV
jgi:hypothetical protein